MASLAQQADHLEPAEDLIDPLAVSLARVVAGVPRGTAIERTPPVRGVLRDVRGHREPAEGVDEVPGVIALVRAQGGAGGQPGGHRQRSPWPASRLLSTA